jgi:hypothetical protein
MPTLKRIHEVVIEDDIRVCFGEDCLQSLKLSHEAFGVCRCILPVETELDTYLDDLSRDAYDADDPKWIGHLEFGLRRLKTSSWLAIAMVEKKELKCWLGRKLAIHSPSFGGGAAAQP